MVIKEFTGTVTAVTNGGASFIYEGTATFSLTLKDPSTPGYTLERACLMLDAICDQLYQDNQSVTITGTVVSSDDANTELLYTWSPNHPR